MGCQNCEKEVASVPLYSVEGERYYAKKSHNTMLVCLILVVCLFLGMMAFCYKVNQDCLNKIEAMNQYWLDYLSQYDFEAYTYEYDYAQDGKGLNIIGNGNGVDYNGPESAGYSSAEDSQSQGRESKGTSYTP